MSNAKAMQRDIVVSLAISVILQLVARNQLPQNHLKDEKYEVNLITIYHLVTDIMFDNKMFRVIPGISNPDMFLLRFGQ